MSAIQTSSHPQVAFILSVHTAWKRGSPRHDALLGIVDFPGFALDSSVWASGAKRTQSIYKIASLLHAQSMSKKYLWAPAG